MNTVDRRRRRLTVDRVIFDTIGILPVRADDCERRTGSAIEWSNRTRATCRRLIDDEAQSARAHL